MCEYVRVCKIPPGIPMWQNRPEIWWNFSKCVRVFKYIIITSMRKWMLSIIIHIEISIMWEVFEGVLSHLCVHTVWMTQAPQIGLKCMSQNGLKEITKICINIQLLLIVDIRSNDPPLIIPCLTTGMVNIFLKYMCPHKRVNRWLKTFYFSF